MFGLREHLEHHVLRDHVLCSQAIVKCLWRDCDVFMYTEENKQVNLGDVMQKGPLCPESSDQKKDAKRRMGAGPRPSLFWYDTDFFGIFRNFNFFFFFIYLLTQQVKGSLPFKKALLLKETQLKVRLAPLKSLQ